MKKVVFASVLALATTTLGSAPKLCAQDSAQAGQITIKDPAEYNAYTNAVGQSSPAAKAAAIEDFLQKYPNSVVKNDLLVTLMATYQAAGNTDKTLDTAKRLVQSDPNNLRGLFMVAYLDKTKGQQLMQSNPSAAGPALDEAADASQKGLAATKPASMSDADFQKLRGAATPIFYEAIALDDESKKDMAGAIQNLTNDLKAYSDPEDTKKGLGLNDTYILGQAYAQTTPPDLKNAAWFLTRAALFAPETAKPQIDKAAKYFYNKYHGSMDGYPQVQALAQNNLFPPADYNPTPAPPPPSPADLAAQTVASTPDLKSLNVGDKEFILFNGKPEDAQKVWDTMKGSRVEFPGKVVSASPTQVQLAVTEDNQQSNKADFTINMKTPLKTPPVVGTTATFDATFDSYTTNPPMITLIDGALPPKAGAKPSPARRRTAH